MPSVSEESVRRELAHYMKAELGMNVKIPEKVKGQNKKKEGGKGAVSSVKKLPATSRPAMKIKEKAVATPATAFLAGSPVSSHPSSSSAKAKSHKARARDRKRKQRGAAATASTTDNLSPSSPPVPTPSANKNTLKNKRRREKEKAARQQKAELKRSAPSLLPSSASSPSPLTTIDPSIKNSTKPQTSSLSTSSPVPSPPSLVAQQQLSEANAARFSSLASQFEQGKWFTHPQALHSPPSSHTVLLDSATQERISSLKAKAQSLLTAYAKIVSQGGGEMSQDDQRWLSQIMTGGTLSDKMAGMQLLMQDRCVGRLDLLERLLQMAQKKGRRESTMAMDALKEIFSNELLPPDRPLTFFSHQPPLLSSSLVEDTTLMYWAFEDAVKQAYTAYLTVLETHLSDPMTYIKKHAINTLFTLLTNIPEREKTVLTLLCNKLGDPDKRIASRIVFLLSELISLHPQMRLAVVKEVESFLYRSGVTERGQYYGIIFLNQMKFRGGQDGVLSRRMIQCYFSVFTQQVKKKDAVNSRLLAGILSGINRALPFAKEGGEMALKDSQIDLLFSLTHTAAFHTAVQAMTLLWQVVSEDVMGALGGRYYRALYELMRGEGVGIGKVSLFLNLLYRSMKGDESEERVAAFVKRLLQVAMGRSAAFLCGCLYLISEVNKKHFAVQRLVQQGDWKMDEDEEEHFVDVKEDNSPSPPADEEEKEEEREEKPAVNGSTPNGSSSSPHHSQAYDPNKREPLYAHANHTGLWELSLLLSHYHPSVQSWARQLLSSSPISYAGDPLVDFTPIAFLDRFVFKNPKKQIKKPALIISSHLQRGGGGGGGVQVSSKSFLLKKEEDVREDEQFYYQYFKEKERRETEGLGKKKKKAKQEEAADDEEAMDAFADQIMEAELLKGQNPDDEDDEELLKALREKGGEEEEVEAEEEGEGEGEMTEEMMAEMDGLDEEEEDAEEAEAEAEAFGEDDEDFEMPTFSDEEEDEEEEEEEDEDELSGRQRKRKRVEGPRGAAGLGSESVFASAEEFADLLNEGVESQSTSRKEREREFTHDRMRDDGRPKGRGRGGRGGGRGGGRKRR